MHHQPCVLRQSLSLAWLPWLLLNTHERLGLWTGFICALHRRGRLYILTKISKKREATRLWLEHRSVCKGALLSGQSLAFASFRNRSPCPSVTAELVPCLDMHLNLSISPAESLSPTWLRLKHWKSETIPFWRHPRLFPLLSTSATHCNLFLCVGLLGSLPATLPSLISASRTHSFRIICEDVTVLISPQHHRFPLPFPFLHPSD